MKPLLAVTLGDPAGTGPELITQALVDPSIRAVCRPVVIGAAAVLRAALAITKTPAAIRVIARAAAADDPATIDVLDLAHLAPASLRSASPRRTAS